MLQSILGLIWYLTGMYALKITEWVWNNPSVSTFNVVLSGVIIIITALCILISLIALSVVRKVCNISDEKIVVLIEGQEELDDDDTEKH